MNKILIVRMSAIGDIVMASGLISAIKRRYPDASISWLVEPASASLLQHHPDLDEVIIWPRQQWQSLAKQKSWGKLIKTVLQFRRELKARGFDWALDAQGLLKSGLLTWFSGASRRIGLGSREGAQYLMTENHPRDLGPMISSEYRQLARIVGCQEEDFRSAIHLPEAVPAEVDDIISQHQLQDGYLLFCPFTTRPQKHWFDNYWQQLADLVEQTWQLPVVVLGGPADSEHAQRLIAGRKNVISLAGKTNLLQSSELIRRSRALVGVDTGITHMGTMHRVPTLALFGSTCPYQQTDSAHTRILYKNLECSPCRRKPTCEGRFDCLRQITPDEVLTNLKEMLNENSAH